MIIFRADGNKTIGTGHIMRCLSIANRARDLGHECLFVLASDDMQNVVGKNGFKTLILNTEYTDMESELTEIKEVICSCKPDLVVIDSYYVTQRYFWNIKNLTKIVYIDDVFSFAYPVDFLINYNIFANQNRYEALYSNSSVKLPQLMIGPQYAPLRKEFINIGVKKIKKQVKNILVLTGGTDNLGISVNVAEQINTNKLKQFDFHFVIGQFNVNIEKLRYFGNTASNIHLHINIAKISELMQESDIAISAAGTTLYELCACGVPTITYVLSDNQIEASASFNQNGIMTSVGDVRINKNYPQLLINEIIDLCCDFEKRTLLSEKMQSIVNSNGAYKIVKELTQ